MLKASDILLRMQPKPNAEGICTSLASATPRIPSSLALRITSHGSCLLTPWPILPEETTEENRFCSPLVQAVSATGNQKVFSRSHATPNCSSATNARDVSDISPRFRRPFIQSLLLWKTPHKNAKVESTIQSSRPVS